MHETIRSEVIRVAYRQRADRAKQFAPFDALKGFREALLKKEKVVVPKAELSEDRKEELDWKIWQIKPKDMVTVIYYQEKEYVKITGFAVQIDRKQRYIQVTNTRIEFKNIYDIQLETTYIE